jgi:hypothetical protein
VIMEDGERETTRDYNACVATNQRIATTRDYSACVATNQSIAICLCCYQSEDCDRVLVLLPIRALR